MPQTSAQHATAKPLPPARQRFRAFAAAFEMPLTAVNRHNALETGY